MKAKPRKCKSLAFRQFKPDDRSNFTPRKSTAYSPFDPKLKIDGKNVGYLVNPEEKNQFKRMHFKFLGKQINENLDEVMRKSAL